MFLKTLQDVIRELIKEVKTPGQFNLESFKRKMAKKYKIPCPANLALLSTYHKLSQKRSKYSGRIEQLLKLRPVRSLSGIVNVSVLTKPWPCPGRCIFCPQEKGVPKSYVSGEPAVERAKTLNYNPYLQVQKRLEALGAGGHPTDKVELRIIGGTWSYYPRRYQHCFIQRCLQACNNFNLSSKMEAAKSQLNPRNLITLQKQNEKARCRIVGITVETRPDFINPDEIKRMRQLGITRVELGVQTVYNDVLRTNRRGHGLDSVKQATQLLKDAGFKVSYQMMPNLPGSSFKRDREMFERLFSSPDFKPDLLKIYPLALVKNSPLYQTYLKKKYKPYSESALTKLLVKIKTKIPYYVRIERIVRDIPSKDIIAGGAKVSNLREAAQKELKKSGLRCKCIRCREVKENYDPGEKIELFRQDYEASAGKEAFLSFENRERDKLYALLRLRIPQYIKDASQYILPVLRGAALIREVHTYGQTLSIEKSSAKKNSGPTVLRAVQHKGLGRKLIRQAEKIVKAEFKLRKMAVIAAVGTREYYRRLGYRLRNGYMVKGL